ncbi:MAG: phosphatidylglycerol lysyltransferase domain-containing protein [Leptolyngbyaceae cyanobacterium MO_188.B28]|nr:phosphatidylglycerol lysyltransferase domain-containing protein [Leptolyngbyaceae cyanobacterium MO_188.B28]
MARTQRTQGALLIAAGLTGVVGVVNLLSAVTPGLPERVAWLDPIFPFEVRASGRLIAALTGFMLLTLATNLLRRKRIAWILTVGLLIISITSNLLKGLDYEESLVSAILLGQLLWMRRIFTAQSDRPSVAQGVRVLSGALLFTLAYGALGFFLLNQHFSTTFGWRQAIVQTLAIFFTFDNAGLEPVTRFGRFFATSIYIIGGATLIYALWMLLRPVLFWSAATPEERQRASKIVEQHGCSSLAQLTLLADKSYYFSPSGQTVIAYVPMGRAAIALGDPIGPPEDRKDAISSFQQFCLQNDWYAAFYQTLPDDLELFESLRFKILQIGEEAIVDLKSFTLEGKAGKNLRAGVNKYTKQGYEVVFEPPPISPERLQQLRQVSDEWLATVHGSEKKFSVGWFDESYLESCEIATVQTSEGGIVAFANILSEYQRNEITIDLMRHRSDLERGAMDFLFVSMFQHFKALGYDTFNLGLVALAGIGAASRSPRLGKGLHYLYAHLNQFYNFQGLYAYKDKFHPHWEPRYLVYSRFIALPDVVVGLIRADSGDRLRDYFRPRS